MTEKKNCIPLGRVVVKAGQLMIGSPIHLSEWKGLGWNAMSEPYSYSLAGVCDACDLPEGGVIAPVCTCEVEDGACEFVPEDETDRYNAVGLGYAIPTTADDGLLQIWGVVGEDGRIESISIDLVPESICMDLDPAKIAAFSFR